MCKSICGVNCGECPSKAECSGCAETNGCPFGKECYIAKYILTGGMDSYLKFKQGLIDEINGLAVDGMETVTELYPLVGKYINLKYPMPSGAYVEFLKNDEMYLGAQVENVFDNSKKSCFGVIARESFLLICEYGENCANPEIVIYKRR